MVRCPDESELNQLLAGDTTAAELRRLEQHVSSCSTCHDVHLSSFPEE